MCYVNVDIFNIATNECRTLLLKFIELSGKTFPKKTIEMDKVSRVSCETIHNMTN